MRSAADKDLIRAAWLCDKPLADKHGVGLRAWYRMCIKPFVLIPVVIDGQSYGGFTMRGSELHAYITKAFPLRRYIGLVQWIIDTDGHCTTQALKENQKACIFLERLGFKRIGVGQLTYKYECTALSKRFER